MGQALWLVQPGAAHCRAAIERERQRRIAAGFADAVQAAQPATAPATDEHLAGAQLELCWMYTSTVDNKTKVRGSHSNRRHPHSMGRHTCTCDCPGHTCRDSTRLHRCRYPSGAHARDGQLFSKNTIKLGPGGMVLVEWEADPDRGE
eukprot:2287120-Prymnesium_polylepis.1